MFGPAQNNSGPIVGQGITKQYQIPKTCKDANLTSNVVSWHICLSKASL